VWKNSDVGCVAVIDADQDDRKRGSIVIIPWIVIVVSLFKFFIFIIIYFYFLIILFVVVSIIALSLIVILVVVLVKLKKDKKKVESEMEMVVNTPIMVEGGREEEELTEVNERIKVESKSPDDKDVVKDDSNYGDSNNVDTDDKKDFDEPEMDDNVNVLQDRKENKKGKKHKGETQDETVEGRSGEKRALAMFDDTIDSLTVTEFGSSGDFSQEVVELSSKENGRKKKMGTESYNDLFNNPILIKKRNK
jgi:hypothetical protein